MGNLIECGERTVQTKDRICIHDITKKYDIKPGDSVIVDIRIPESSEYIGEELANEWNSSKLMVMGLISSLDTINALLADWEAGKLSKEDREEVIISTHRHLKSLRYNMKSHFSIGDKEYSKFQKARYGCDSDE